MHRGEMATPFDRHLLDVYAGRTPDGLAFFEEYGYFDVSDAANTVQMFRENVGMKEFWDDYESLDRLDPFERAAVFPFGSKSKVPSNRTRSVLHRTNFERFALQAKDGNSMIEDDLLEMERDYRLKVKILELDDDDEAELETKWVCMKEAIEVIRVEKYHVHQVLFRALKREDSEEVAASCDDRYTTPEFIDFLPNPPQVAQLDLLPYCGNLFVLRESITLLRRSWSKRWCILDFRSFKVRLYKRSYWRRPRGELDLRLATKIEMMGHGGFLVFMRSRNEREIANWVQLVRFAAEMVRVNAMRCPEISGS